MVVYCLLLVSCLSLLCVVCCVLCIGRWLLFVGHRSMFLVVSLDVVCRLMFGVCPLVFGVWRSVFGAWRLFCWSLFVVCCNLLCLM